MDHHSAVASTERIKKWMLRVKARRARRTSRRVPKVRFVARRSVGVGPGVKIEAARESKKVGILVGGGMGYGLRREVCSFFVSRVEVELLG